MEFRVLGPVELWDGTERVSLGRAKERNLLGVLALHGERPVTIQTLVDALWDDNPPAQARKDIQIYVSRLRKCLRDSGASAKIITQRGAYTFRLEDDAVDYGQFHQLLNLGRKAHGVGRLAVAPDLLHDAVGKWADIPIADLTTSWIEQKREELENYDRISGYQALCDVELDRGNYRLVLHLLENVSDGHELDSTFAAQRLAALDGCGDYAEFDVYWRQIHRRNVESFGTAPPRELQELHSRLLQRRDASDLDDHHHVQGQTRATWKPAHLPPLTSDFVGRQAELARLDAKLAQAQMSGTTAPLVITITGLPGVGKTEIALQWAHSIKKQFPDGQLFAELAGYAPDGPADPAEVAAEFLEALGTTREEMPSGIGARAARLRTALDAQRVLMVLDDARDSNQVRNLLPASAQCLVVVTSRQRLSSLTTRNGAYRLTIQPLPPTDAALLLQRLLDRAEQGLDSNTIEALAAVPQGLPAAIRMIAEIVPSNPDIDMFDLLHTGEYDTQTIDAAFASLLESIPAYAADLFVLINTHPGLEFSVDVATAIAGTTPAHMRQSLQVLANVNLVEVLGQRIRVHLVTHVFANSAGKARSAMGDAGARRMLDWYIDGVRHACQALTTGPLDADAQRPLTSSEEDALGWMDLERENIALAVDLAAERTWPQAWILLASMRPYIELEEPPRDWVKVHAVTLSAARAAGDRDAEAAMLMGTATAHRKLGHRDQELEALRHALELYRASGGMEGRSEALSLMADNYLHRGDNAAAVEHARAAVALHDDLDSPALHALAQYELAVVFTRTGELDEALTSLVHANTIYQRQGNSTGMLKTRTQEALVLRARGHSAEAMRVFEKALDLRLDATASARRHAIPAMVNLSELYSEDGSYERAHMFAREAIGACRSSQDYEFIVRALVVLVHSLKQLDRRDEAGSEATKLVEIIGENGDNVSKDALQQLRNMGLWAR